MKLKPPHKIVWINYYPKADFYIAHPTKKAAVSLDPKRRGGVTIRYKLIPNK